jgi:Glycosyl hydrolase 36 superfamily, catalytic domain
MKKYYSLMLLLLPGLTATAQEKKTVSKELIGRIKADTYFPFVKAKALEVMKAGFNAGDGYREVWIRDYNTFIELAAEVNTKEVLKENLLVFFRMQGGDGNIIDGFTPAEQIKKEETDFSYSKLEPRYAGHKNTVETDQESSLVQSVYKYIKVTGDRSILNETIGGTTVSERLNWAMEFLITHRFNAKYGLIIGATTADWGDVQPEHGWGVDLDSNSHYAIDIYDNAMFIIALDNLIEMIPSSKQKWGPVKDAVAKNCRRHLWDNKQQKFIPHIYLNGSPFPAGFDENAIYYFGGTAVAIEAGLLSRDEVKASLDEMVKRVKLAGAGSIGLTLYPPYPDGYFANKIMNPIYSYQNGGDWTWFGARMVQQLIKYGFVEEAYEQMQPMVKRVKDNNGFYEWYSVDNKPRGSGTFRGEAGVLYTAILMFEKLIR